MTETPQDLAKAKAKAQAFFQKGKTVSDTGQYDYAITLMLEGLNFDPDDKDAHQALREISLKRKASGGKGLGMLERMKIRPGRDDKQNMLNAEKQLAYEPGSTDQMVALIQAAHKAGFYDTVRWIGPILQRANADSKTPDVNKYIVLKDIYKNIREWTRAVEACRLALELKPLDMDLQSELKNLGAQETMYEKGYADGGDFRTTLRDAEGQQRLMEEQRDVVSHDALSKTIVDAETEYRANPNDAARLNKLVESLERTEDIEHENRAIELLEAMYERTRIFTHRHRAGQIKMNQMRRMERSLRAEVEKNPADESLRRSLDQFHADQLEFELQEYSLWADKYPTEQKFKFETARRLFALKRFDEAIPLFQQARNDPKLRVDGTIWLGRAFLDAGFVEESVETLQAVLDEYQIKGDERAKEMYYWQARAFEAAGNVEMAIKRLSQIAQWEFTYRDVQQRIKRLRSAAGPK